MLIIKIVNDATGTNESANYQYQVMINQSVIYSGRVIGHNRNTGWVGLLKLLTDKFDSGGTMDMVLDVIDKVTK